MNQHDKKLTQTPDNLSIANLKSIRNNIIISSHRNGRSAKQIAFDLNLNIGLVYRILRGVGFVKVKGDNKCTHIRVSKQTRDRALKLALSLEYQTIDSFIAHLLSITYPESSIAVQQLHKLAESKNNEV